MNLKTIINRTIPPVSWAEGENIPWNDPDFSRRMLAEHLSQEHNLASRRSRYRPQVAVIHDCSWTEPTRILELACGPGLYTSRLPGWGCCDGHRTTPPIRSATPGQNRGARGLDAATAG